MRHFHRIQVILATSGSTEVSGRLLTGLMSGPCLRYINARQRTSLSHSAGSRWQVYVSLLRSRLLSDTATKCCFVVLLASRSSKTYCKIIFVKLVKSMSKPVHHCDSDLKHNSQKNMNWPIKAITQLYSLISSLHC